MTCFTEDDRGFPAIAADHQEAFDAFVKDHLYDHPLYRPQTLPPAPWTDWENDYLGTSIRTAFVKANDPQTHAEIKAAFADGSILEHVRAVNALQAVPFTINEVTLRLLKQFGAKEFKREIAIADALVGKQFWCPLRCDRRGRLIHLSDFNPFRGDEVRSLFLFAQGKPIGSSIAWLEIAIAHSYGKSGTLTERTDWVRDNIDLIKACAEGPNSVFRLDPAPEKPYQFVAACVEYVAAAADTSDYETRLPIWLDATSNGLQHLAMLRRDPELAGEVNLNTDWDKAAILFYRRRNDGAGVPVIFEHDVVLGENQIVGPEAREWLATRADKPKGIYAKVARRVHSNLTADGSNELSQFWLGHHKDLARLGKQPVMTVSYGATPSGRRDQLREKAKKLKIFLPRENYSKLIKHLEEHIWKAMQALPPTATAIKTRDFIQEIAKSLLKHNKYMRWVSPSGFPVANRYHKSKTGDDQRVLLKFSGQRITISDGYTDELREQKTINAVVANFVQSLDAAHLALSVNEATKRGIQAASVHDCYATVAPDVSAFARIRRFALGVMYYHNPLEDLWSDNVIDKDALPMLELGTLDPLVAAFSDYSEV